MKAVAFLDLLGFSNAVKRSADEALSMLQSYNSILQLGLVEAKLHPSDSYAQELQALANRTSTESFDSFLPFSDSIFITSNNCSDFILQLGSFLERSFHFTAHIYEFPENPKDPTAYHNISLGDDGNGRFTEVETSCHVPPALFRGGVAFGDVNIITPSALLNGQRIEGHTLMGEAVVRAVGMEKLVKGPRIVFDKSVYDQLNDKARLYCRNLPEETNYYELLWPAVNYILENSDSFENEIHHFSDMFNPAYNLWNFYKNDPKISVQYERFIELIVASTINIYNHMRMRDFAIHHIGKIIEGKFNEAEMTKVFGYLNVFWKN